VVPDPDGRLDIIGLVADRPQRGKFITFEGLDGSGKSTQLEKLAQALRQLRIEVVTTREPGGTAIGEQIRGLLLDSRTHGLDPQAELALMSASRAQLIAELILPALEAGKWVLCDRFIDSTEAYQGSGRKLGSEPVLQLHRLLCRDLWPDLTILMDSDVSGSVKRALRRNKAAGGTRDESRFEKESQAFFGRVHEGFLEIARREPQRVVMIDAHPPIEVVHGDIMCVVRERLIDQETSYALL
jgi:dTMP kinase